MSYCEGDEHDRAWLAQVGPGDWRNPSPKGTYNLVVIGGGTAGLVSAMGAAGLGARVALVERELLGGDCLNFGCVPSKALIASARRLHDVARVSRLGAPSWQDRMVEFEAVMARMRRLRASIAHHDGAARLATAGVDVFLGDGRFVARNAIEVVAHGEKRAANVGPKGALEDRAPAVRLRFHRAVIATGARATIPPIPGLREAGYWTNETVFAATQLPRRLVVIGAGPIGCELAQSFRRFGSEVTVIGAEPRLLPREDPGAAELLAAAFKEEGIALALGAKVLGVTADEAAHASAERGHRVKQITFDRGLGAEAVLADAILVATGRTPNVEGLGLEHAGVTFDARGVTVDARLCTKNRRIYAAGDICSPYKFTHAADGMARVVLQNALFFGRKKASALVIPWSTYTDPEIAHVGLYAHQEAEAGQDVRTFTAEFAAVDRAILEEDTRGFARLSVDARTGRILGATVVGRHAGELIAQASLAMTEGLPASAFSRVILPYPTHAEVWKRLGDAYARTRLKPWIHRLFLRYFAWIRGTEAEGA